MGTNGVRGDQLMKLSLETVIHNIVYSTIDAWIKRCPDKRLEDYSNWCDDIVSNVVAYVNKEKGKNAVNKTKEGSEDVDRHAV
jgi:hypothetical protein